MARGAKLFLCLDEVLYICSLKNLTTLMNQDMQTILTFKPYYKNVLWGGGRIARFKGCMIPIDTLGESWEVSDMEGGRSVVADGPLEGLSITDLIKRYGDDFLGTGVDTRRFPLLVKLIDAHQRLSLQVHPDDILAARLHNAPGKSEMWYVLEAEPGAKIYCGLTRSITPEEFDRMASDGSILDVVNSYEVSPGQFYDIPAGTLHAIGSGCLLAEIQQPADITYRVFDYNRLDSTGLPRTLHLDLARQAMRFEQPAAVRLDASPDSNDGRIKSVGNPYFTVRHISLQGPEDSLRIDSDGETFGIFLIASGEARLEIENGTARSAGAGISLLVPAAVRTVTLSGNATVLYVTPRTA